MHVHIDWSCCLRANNRTVAIISSSQQQPSFSMLKWHLNGSCQQIHECLEGAERTRLSFSSFAKFVVLAPFVSTHLQHHSLIAMLVSFAFPCSLASMLSMALLLFALSTRTCHWGAVLATSNQAAPWQNGANETTNKMAVKQVKGGGATFALQRCMHQVAVEEQSAAGTGVSKNCRKWEMRQFNNQNWSKKSNTVHYAIVTCSLLWCWHADAKHV